MKENSFKFRESFGRAVSSMTDKQAGQLIKGLSGYVFEGRKLQSNDNTIKSSFTLMKTALDAEERDKQNGRIGGLTTAERRREYKRKYGYNTTESDGENGRNGGLDKSEQNKEQQDGMSIFNEFIREYIILETMKALMSDEKEEENSKKNEGKVLQKTENDKQDKENATKPHFRRKASGKPASCGEDLVERN